MKAIVNCSALFILALSCAAQAPARQLQTQAPQGQVPVQSWVLDIAPGTNHLGQIVTITVTNLNSVLTNAQARQKEIFLFINGKELSNNTPIGIDLAANKVQFKLKRTAQNKDTWIPLLQYPILEPVRKIRLSIGLQGDNPLPIDDKAGTTWLHVIGWDWWTGMWLTIFAILIIIFLLLSVHSDILRSPVKDPSGRHPFSLSRSQAAFWLFIIVLSFVFILVITGDLSTLNGSVLALIGISAGTYISSTLLEQPASPATTAAAAGVAAAQAGLAAGQAAAAAGQAAAAAGQAIPGPAAAGAGQAAAGAADAAAGAAQAAAGAGQAAAAASQAVAAPTQAATGAAQAAAGAAHVAAGAAQAAAASSPPINVRDKLTKTVTGAVLRLQSSGFVGRFLGDILADNDGISVHRFQIFVWTLVLGIIFIRSVVTDLSMPEFSGTLLALMGISSATYISAKLTQ